MRFLSILSVSVLLSSCSKFTVAQFHLRDRQMAIQNVDAIKAETKYRFGNAVSSQEYRDKLGQYYVCRWSTSIADDQRGTVVVELNYRQAKTGQEIQSKSQEVSARKGKVEFAITGDEYLQRGKVLAWQAEVKQNGRVLASEQSFLWE